MNRHRIIWAYALGFAAFYSPYAALAMPHAHQARPLAPADVERIGAAA